MNISNIKLTQTTDEEMFCVGSRTIGTHHIMKRVGVFTYHLLFRIKMKSEKFDGLDW
jgi:hypothetical protein